MIEHDIAVPRETEFNVHVGAPEVNDPEAIEPEASEPEAKEPGAKEPEAGEPETNELKRMSSKLVNLEPPNPKRKRLHQINLSMTFQHSRGRSVKCMNHMRSVLEGKSSK